MLIILITFLRQPVIKLEELVPHERFSQTSGIIDPNELFIYLFIYYL